MHAKRRSSKRTIDSEHLCYDCTAGAFDICGIDEAAARTHTLETVPLHFQLPPTKNLRPDILEALEAKPLAAVGARAPAESAAENMVCELS